VLLRIINLLLYLLFFPKFFELIVYPRDISICNNQFDFRSGFDVYNGTSLLNDLICIGDFSLFCHRSVWWLVQRLEQPQICLLDKKPVMAKPMLRVLIVDITAQDK